MKSHSLRDIIHCISDCLDQPLEGILSGVSIFSKMVDEPVSEKAKHKRMGFSAFLWYRIRPSVFI